MTTCAVRLARTRADLQHTHPSCLQGSTPMQIPITHSEQPTLTRGCAEKGQRGQARFCAAISSPFVRFLGLPLHRRRSSLSLFRQLCSASISTFRAPALCCRDGPRPSALHCPRDSPSRCGTELFSGNTHPPHAHHTPTTLPHPVYSGSRCPTPSSPSSPSISHPLFFCLLPTPLTAPFAHPPPPTVNCLLRLSIRRALARLV